MKVINGSVAPALYGMFGIVFFMWLDRVNEEFQVRENKRLGERNFAQTAMLDALVRHGAFACAEFDSTGALVTQNFTYQERITPLLRRFDFNNYDRTRPPVHTAEKFWHGLTLALEGSIQAKILNWTAKDGETITYKARFIPFRPSVAEFNHVMVCLTDITEALDSRQQLLEAKHLQAIGLLASGVAHEYNNILTGVIAMSELALREAVNDAQRSHLEIVVQAAKRCTDLSGNLLAISRSSPSQNEALDLREVIHETSRLVRHSRGVHLELLESVDSSAHITVVGNRNELATLLLNLMINACDAMENRGTITLRIDYAQIARPAFSPEPTPHVVLQLSDTGPGIPEEIIPHIFEPFFTTNGLARAPASVSRPPKPSPPPTAATSRPNSFPPAAPSSSSRCRCSPGCPPSAKRPSRSRTLPPNNPVMPPSLTTTPSCWPPAPTSCTTSVIKSPPTPAPKNFSKTTPPPPKPRSNSRSSTSACRAWTECNSVAAC
jgi:signal transduction histidine kinase